MNKTRHSILYAQQRALPIARCAHAARSSAFVVAIRGCWLSVLYMLGCL